MRYVIIRDDDTNALTPPECLERLYRPFLERGMPVNLATIPAVNTQASMADGQPEGFLLPHRRAAHSAPGGWDAAQVPAGVKARVVVQTPARSEAVRTVPIGSNQKLVRYLLDNPGYRIVQHGCHHDYLEFDCPTHLEVGRRLEQGTRLLMEAGFSRPETFVAPYDRLSRASLQEVSTRFRVLSTGWYELRRLPYAWWPRYAVKKLCQAPHWQIGRTLLLTHPGCLLSYKRTYSTMLGGILHYLESQQVTVLVTHWWEYFREEQPDQPFIDFLHETAAFLAGHPGLKVISFSDLVTNHIPLN